MPSWTSVPGACSPATRPMRTGSTHPTPAPGAERAGASIREAPQNFATGDRFASIRDPFGIRWTVMTRVEDVSAEERDRRLSEWADQNVH
jgi:hypothetical protein